MGTKIFDNMKKPIVNKSLKKRRINVQDNRLGNTSLAKKINNNTTCKRCFRRAEKNFVINPVVTIAEGLFDS